MRQLILFVILIMLCTNVSAQGLGVSPTSLDTKILRGNSAHLSFVLHNPSNEPIDFVVYNQDLPDWFDFNPNSGTIVAKSVQEIDVLVNPPELTSNGVYDTLIIAKLENNNLVEGVALNIGTAIKTKVTITGKQLVNMVVKGVRVEDVELDSSVIFTIEIMNNGNTNIVPTTVIMIKRNNVLVDKISKELTGIMPGVTKQYSIEWPTKNKNIGDYTAHISVNINGDAVKEISKAFKILPYGKLAISGVLEELIVIESERLIKVVAVFSNTGDVATKAKLKVELYSDNKLINTFSSDELLVLGKEKKELIAYSKLDKPGDYQLKGFVLYNSKQTAPKTVTFSTSKSNNQQLYGTAITFSIVVSGYLAYELYRKLRK